MDRKLLSLSFMALPGLAAARDPGSLADAANAANWTPVTLGGGRFFFCLVAGVLLALGFQWILTTLAAAVGSSALAGDRDPARKRFRKEGGSDAEGAEDRILKVENGMGIWALATGCVSLFAAAWLAAELIRFGTRGEAVILGLTIWAGFLATMVRMEAAAIGSMLGGVIGIFKQGLGAAGAPLQAAAKKAAEAASGGTGTDPRAIEEKVREEFRRQDGGRGLKDKLHGYLENMDTRGQDRFEIETEANGLFEDADIRAMARRGELQRVDRNRFREMIASRGDISAEESGQWADALYNRWSALREESRADRPAAAAGQAVAPETLPSESAPAPAVASGTAVRSPEGTATLGTAQAGEAAKIEGGSRSEAGARSEVPARGEAAESGSVTALSGGFKERLQGFKNFLRTSDRRELNPVRLEQEVETLVVHPEDGFETIEKDARSLRRDEVVKVLRTRRDISSQEADSIADLVDSARTRMLSRSEIREHRIQESTDKAIARLRDLIYGLKRPERDYEGFRSDIARLVEDAGSEAGDGLGTDPKGMDRDSLFKLFFSKPGISKQDAERMADTVEPVLREAREREQRIEAETRKRVEEARIAIQARAEGARAAATAAAWWLFGISLATGAAAALGGWIGATTT